MQNIKDKTKYLFSYFLSPKEIIFIFSLLFLSCFFFLAFLYRGSTYLMSERIVYSGHLTEGIIGSPKETNPYKVDTQIDKDLHRLLFSSLIKNLEGEKFDLSLAESVETNTAKDSYKVKLRENIYFSDSNPITVEDVLFSLSNIPIEKNYTVEKTDEKTLTFKLKSQTKESEREAFLENFTYPIIPKDEVFENNFSMDLVTSSFFKIKSIKKDLDGNVTQIALERFDNGEAKLPYLETYTLSYFKTDVEAYNAFQKRELDLLSGLPGNTISKITDDTNIKFEVTPLPNNFAVFLNQNKNESLRDASLRKAMSDIVDRESLTNQVLGSFGIPQKNILGEKGSPKTADEVIDSLGSSFSFKDGVLYTGTKKTQNANSAKGENNSDTEKEAVKIKITTIENRELEETAKFLKLAWKKIGIETEIEIIDRKDLSTVVKDRNFEALLFGYSIKKPSDYYSFFSSKERNYPKLNISNYTSKQVDKILDVLINETEENRIKDLTNQLSVEITEDNPVIVLYKPQFVFAHFLKTQIKLPNTIKKEDDRYAHIESWYTSTEKVLSPFKESKLVDKLDILLY